jgi:hypothetical protein
LIDMQVAIAFLFWWAAGLHPGGVVAADEQPSGADIAAAGDEAKPKLQYATRILRGRVVWLSEAMERRFGVQAVREARERILALETPDGVLYPLVEDLRGRSFRKDQRLREMDLELLVRQYRGVPMVQVIQVAEVSDAGRFLVDYWCDTCSIVMYEDGPCDCCQEHNRLRKRPVESLHPEAD